MRNIGGGIALMAIIVLNYEPDPSALSAKEMRIATVIVGVLDTLLWLVVAISMFFSLSDPATKGLDVMAGILVSALFLLTGLPALLLAWRDTMPRLAFALAIAFPAAFVLLFVAAMVAFA